MDWDNERYVRVYTRETVDDVALSWEARAIWNEMLKRFDRAGLLRLGDHGLLGLATTIRIPAAVVEQHFPALLRDGRVQQRGDTLIAPNFIEAQEAVQTDAARQKASRERARAKAQLASVTAGDSGSRQVGALKAMPVTAGDGSVTPGDASVTPGDATVTPNVAVPSCADPPDPDDPQPAAPAGGTEFQRYVLAEWLDVKGVDEFERRALDAFPGLDLAAEARKARGWESASPRNRKTNHGKFFWNWLSRAHERLLEAERQPQAKPKNGAAQIHNLPTNYGKPGRQEL